MSITDAQFPGIAVRWGRLARSRHRVNGFQSKEGRKYQLNVRRTLQIIHEVLEDASRASANAECELRSDVISTFVIGINFEFNGRPLHVLPNENKRKMMERATKRVVATLFHIIHASYLEYSTALLTDLPQIQLNRVGSKYQQLSFEATAVRHLLDIVLYGIAISNRVFRLDRVP